MLKGWQFTGTGEPLKYVEQEIPKAKPGYVVVKVSHCGLCHSDVGALDDPGWVGTIILKVPVIMGHETAGEIVEVGEGVTDWKVGDRVAINPMPTDNSQGHDHGPGYGRDGGYANYTTAPIERLIKVPDNVDMIQAAAATDAGMTSHNAVVNAGGVKKGTKVGIIGIGGLGTVGARIAIGLGAEVYAASRSEAARNKIKADGAFKVAPSIKDFKDDGLEVIVDFAGADITTRDALEVIAPGGTIVIVGMAKLETTLNVQQMISKYVTVKGSIGGGGSDIESVINLISQGKLKIDVQPVSFDEVPEKLDYMREHSLEKRFIMENKEEDYK